MKCVLYKRKELKLILMSATINLELFSNYFAEENIEVIQVKNYTPYENPFIHTEFDLVQSAGTSFITVFMY